jgi:hypothetical protein
MDNTQLTPQHHALAKKVQWGLGLAGAAIVSPVIFLAVKGLIGLSIAGLIGVTVWNFAPVVGIKLATWKLRAVKADARNNPIETMEQLYMNKVEEIREKDRNIEKNGAIVK